MGRDPNKDLETLALFTSGDVKTAVQAAIVTLNADLRFAQCERKEELFATNPANTVAYQAMHALEGEAIVRVSEALGKDAGLLPAGTEVRRKADLVCHRHAISHAYTISWTNPKMQEFAARDRQWLDRKAALVWDMWRSLNELLVERDLPSGDMTVGIGWQHAAIVHLIMRSSVKPGVELPSEQSIFEHLQKFRDDYINLLVKEPDGRNQEAEDRSRARKEERRGRWSKPG
jgi:hypothetical protein